MPLTHSDGATREPAAPVPMVQCPPERRRDRPCAGSDFHHPPVLVVPHHHPARVAGQPLRRSRGNVRPVFERRLPGLSRIRQDRGVYMDHDLVPLCGGTRGRARDEALPRPARPEHPPAAAAGSGRPRPGSTRRGNDRAGAAPLVERLAGRVERTQQQRAHLRGKAPAKHQRAVRIRVDVQRAAGMLARGLASLGLPVHLAPPLHDALHVDRGACARYREQTRLGLRGRDAGQSTDLGVGQLSTLQGRRHRRQRPEGARYPHALTSGARGESDAPREPLGAGAEAGVPAAARRRTPG